MNYRIKYTIVTAFILAVMAAVAQPVLAASLPNPLGDVYDPRDVIGNIIRALLGIVGSIALAIFILGGFYWVTSAGNEEKITKGKNMILWATFGLAVIFFAYAIVTFVVGAITGGGPNVSSSDGPAVSSSDGPDVSGSDNSKQ